MALAGKCEADGKITSGGAGLDLEEIADSLHIKTPADRQSLESMIEKMVERGSLTWNEHRTLTMINFKERQKVPPSSRPDAVAERVRQYRERQKTGEQPPTKKRDYFGGRMGHLVHGNPKDYPIEKPPPESL